MDDSGSVLLCQFLSRPPLVPTTLTFSGKYSSGDWDQVIYWQAELDAVDNVGWKTDSQANEIEQTRLDCSMSQVTF